MGTSLPFLPQGKGEKTHQKKKAVEERGEGRKERTAMTLGGRGKKGRTRERTFLFNAVPR